MVCVCMCVYSEPPENYVNKPRFKPYVWLQLLITLNVGVRSGPGVNVGACIAPKVAQLYILTNQYRNTGLHHLPGPTGERTAF